MCVGACVLGIYSYSQLIQKHYLYEIRILCLFSSTEFNKGARVKRRKFNRVRCTQSQTNMRFASAPKENS